MDGSTIYALSSGAPPAAIAIVRVSGPRATDALQRLAGSLPTPRHAVLRTLRHPISDQVLDRALVLYFKGPDTSTGEDLVELHLHGGRAVVSAVLAALSLIEGLRPALAGEFTRRAFEHGRMDLAEAEGLADLLAAETEAQRRAALALSGGALSRLIDTWLRHLLTISASVEAELDFSDEADVTEAGSDSWRKDARALVGTMRRVLARPPAERLKDGIRVVIAGPPNAGKSTLINALSGRDVAIVSPLAGTTRDRIEAPVALGGVAFVLTDTAGLRGSDDMIEAAGIARARESLQTADIIIWLGTADQMPDDDRAILVSPKADVHVDPSAALAVSALTGFGLDKLTHVLISKAQALLPQEGEVTVNRRHRALLDSCVASIEAAAVKGDLLAAAEELRAARSFLNEITGRAGVEAMLDVLFGGFCIGK